MYCRRNPEQKFLRNIWRNPSSNSLITPWRYSWRNLRTIGVFWRSTTLWTSVGLNQTTSKFIKLIAFIIFKIYGLQILHSSVCYENRVLNTSNHAWRRISFQMCLIFPSHKRSTEKICISNTCSLLCNVLFVERSSTTVGLGCQIIWIHCHLQTDLAIPDFVSP